jgi:hypothetical protein
VARDLRLQDAPAAFETAALVVGDDIVDLPEPGTGKGSRGSMLLPVRRPPRAGGERLRIEEEVVALTEELRRARADLQAERDGRAADALAFREGLARLRAVADGALADDRRSRDAELADLRERMAELDDVGAEADRLRVQADGMRAEIEGLRAEAEASRVDAEETRRRIHAARNELDGAAQLAERLTAGTGEQREEG